MSAWQEGSKEPGLSKAQWDLLRGKGIPVHPNAGPVLGLEKPVTPPTTTPVVEDVEPLMAGDKVFLDAVGEAIKPENRNAISKAFLDNVAEAMVKPVVPQTNPEHVIEMLANDVVVHDTQSVS